MDQNNISILSTRPLNEEWIAAAREMNIDIEINAFIETETIKTIEVIEEIENAFLRSAYIVFTSVNAVNAVGEILDQQVPDWKIFCIGHATKQQVVKYFGEVSIAGFANNAEELADVIMNDLRENGDDASEVIFFCGNKRREELPQILSDQGVEVNEIVVYETISIPHKLQKHYNGVLFFSPSAVETFFKNNKADARTILFAIGNTTAASIRKHTDNKIIISDEPSKDGMLGKLKEYYEK